MSEFGKITLPGIEDLIKDLDKYEEKIQAEVGAEIEASARTIIRNAKRNVQAQKGTDQGNLVRLISNEAVDKMTQELISGAEYSAFREFGTKSRTRVDPPELVPLAQQFRGAKLAKGGLGFRQSIYEWAKRKGIAKELWWPIYNSIRKKGTWGKPYFFPAYYNEIPLLRKRLENILNETQP